MPRRALIRSTEVPYHVTSRSNNKEWFYVPLPVMWEVCCEQLRANSALYGTVVHAFTLLSNHFHMVLTSPHESLGEVMRHLLTEISRSVQRKSQRINHVFGSRYKWSLLDNASSVAYVYKYVLRNPVRAGLSESVATYPFSSFHPTQGLEVPIAEGFDAFWKWVPREHEERRAWLDIPTPKELEDHIKNGLRRATFAFSKGNPQSVRFLAGELLHRHATHDPRIHFDFRRGAFKEICPAREFPTGTCDAAIDRAEGMANYVRFHRAGWYCAAMKSQWR